MNNPKELKNKIIKLNCTDIGYNFEGIARHENFAIFINNALPEEIVDARVERVEKSFAFAKTLNIISQNNNRIKPACEYFSLCGGCSCQHVNYEYTLQLKSKLVQNLFSKFSINYVSKNNALGSNAPFHSRNKTSLPVREENGEIHIGFFKKRSHHIVDIDECIISQINIFPIINALRKWMIDYKIKAYNEIKHSGCIRHIVIRTNKYNQIMIILVSNTKTIPYVDRFIDSILQLKVNVVSIYQNINTAKNNVILGNTCNKLYGEPYLLEYLHDLKFIINPLSFFQVNTKQCEVLYDTAIKMLDINTDDVCIDAYCGAGTISLFLAKKVKKVYGIEIVEPAIEAAKQNAKINNINNVEFVCAKVEDYLPTMAKSVKANVLVLDPPRKGIEKSVINSIKTLNPNKILYISCKADTQARDIQYLSEIGYKVKDTQSVDMFCYSSEIENIAVLEKIK